MFNLFKKKEEVKEVEKVDEVLCDTCKHKIGREYAQKICVSTFGATMENLYSSRFESRGNTYYGSYYSGYIFYCPIHKKNYDAIYHHIGQKDTYYITIPEHREEVNKKGEEIAKKRKKEWRSIQN